MRFITVLLVVLTLSAHAWAQKPPVAPAVAASGAGQSQSESAQLAAALEQVKLLQAQIQVTKDYHTSLLDTVYWALGGVFFVTSAILGFGWFANFKVYDRDKLALREELDARFGQLAAGQSSEMQTLSLELRTSLSDQMAQSTSTLSGQVISEVAQKIDPVNASIRRIEKRVFQIELARRKERMIANPSDHMALSDALNLLELCQERAQDDLPEIMKFMLDKIATGGRLTAGEITRVNAVIDTLPTQYKALCDRLREKLVASDIF